jgi:hypothetical protein
MRKHSTWILAIGVALALAAGGVASAEKPVKVIAGNLSLTFNGGFTPKRLPKTEQAGIKLSISGKIATLDGTHPPALKEFVLETDRNGAINAKGLPVCTASKLQAQDTKHAEKACPDAIVGEGQTIAEIEFAEQPPIDVDSKLIAFNGGVKGGTTTIFIHAYLSSPVSAAIVTTVKVKKVRNGRYGIKSVASIPVIAGGNGSVKSFNLTIKRNFTYRGKRQSYLLLKCTDGKVFAKGTAVFRDGTRATGSVIRTCTPKGKG